MDCRLVARSLVALLAGWAVLSSAPEADACEYTNCQSSGAVNKPSDFEISFPFKNGEKVYILSGYGPQAGSSLHCRASDSLCANDWYALDLTLPNHSNHGKGQPVLASASGTVISADWGTKGWANYGKRVYIEHDYNADGHKYVTMYAHLDSMAVSKGDHVDKGDKIGTLGASCQQQQTCSSFGTPHVHWSLHQDSNFGGSGTGGSYGGHAVKPEPIDGYTGIKQGQTRTSKNGSGGSMSDKCGTTIPASGGWVEEDSKCAEVVGTLSDANGHDGHAFVGTHQTQAPNYAHGVIYKLNFEKAGTYTVSATLPSGVGNLTGGALYKIAHSGGSKKVTVDQSANSGQVVELGTFQFDEADPENQWVRLGDNYADSADKGKNFVLDGIRLQPGDGCDCSTQGERETRACPGGVEARTCDGCEWSAWSACQSGGEDTGTGGTVDTGGGGTGGDVGLDVTPGYGDAVDTGTSPAGGGSVSTNACACSATDSSGGRLPFGWIVFAIGWVAVRRVRR